MDRLARLETYCDTVPRAHAHPEEIGPFTLFLKNDADSWDYYARPRLGLEAAFTTDDVRRVRDRQRELGASENLEWVHETTPSLLAAVRRTDLMVHECPLMVLAEDPAPATLAAGFEVRALTPDSADLAPVCAAVEAGFSSGDSAEQKPVAYRREWLRAGLLAMVGAFDADGPVGGGSHSPRDGTTELTGIAVIPRARRQGLGAALTAALVRDAGQRGVGTVFLSASDDSVARVYASQGFVRVGTACIAEAP